MVFSRHIECSLDISILWYRVGVVQVYVFVDVCLSDWVLCEW